MSAEDLTPEQKKDFTEAFSLFDKDGNGSISIKELEAVMRSLGLKPTEIELMDLIKSVDTINADGMIQLSEFLNLMASKVKLTGSEEEMKEVFSIFDKRGLGYITTLELRDVMANLGEKLTEDELIEMIQAADKSGTGKVYFDDFVEMVTSK